MKRFLHGLTIVSLIMLFALSDLASSSDNPWVHYLPEQWYSDPYKYKGFRVYPDSGLSAYTDRSSSEPPGCYPMHSGAVRGVSDTLSISVYIQNHDTVDFNIDSYTPSEWFMPAVWEASKDPNIFKPYIDTSGFEYVFETWETSMFKPVSKPSVITKKRGSPSYRLVYRLWDLPLGRSRVLMIPTEDLIDDVEMLTNYTAPIWVTNATVLADTINAFGACFWRAFYRQQYPIALSWCDSMFAVNSTCVPAYYLQSQAYGYRALNDSLNELTALDSVLAIMDRYGDPVFGDTSTWIEPEWDWYRQMIIQSAYQREKVINGGRGIWGM